MTKTLLLALATLGCTADPSAVGDTSERAPLPEKVYDFSSRPLSTAASAPTTSRSAKAQLRAAFDPLLAGLVRCTAGTAGELAIKVRIVLDVDLPATLAGVEVTYPEKAAEACARQVVSGMDVSGLEIHESAMVTVHMPFVVGANS